MRLSLRQNQNMSVNRFQEQLSIYGTEDCQYVSRLASELFESSSITVIRHGRFSCFDRDRQALYRVFSESSDKVFSINIYHVIRHNIGVIANEQKTAYKLVQAYGTDTEDAYTFSEWLSLVDQPSKPMLNVAKERYGKHQWLSTSEFQDVLDILYGCIQPNFWDPAALSWIVGVPVKNESAIKDMYHGPEARGAYEQFMKTPYLEITTYW